MNTTELSFIITIFLIMLTIITIETLLLFYLLRHRIIPTDEEIKELLK